MHLCLGRKCSLIMTPKYVQGYACYQVDFGVQADLFGALALVVICDDTVEGLLRDGLGGIDGHMQVNIEAQSKTDHIKPWPDIGG